MKIKVSVSMEESTLELVKQVVDEDIFRNKSHFIELATKKYLIERKNEKRNS